MPSMKHYLIIECMCHILKHNMGGDVNKDVNGFPPPSLAIKIIRHKSSNVSEAMKK